MKESFKIFPTFLHLTMTAKVDIPLSSLMMKRMEEDIMTEVISVTEAHTEILMPHLSVPGQISMKVFPVAPVDWRVFQKPGWYFLGTINN